MSLQSQGMQAAKAADDAVNLSVINTPYVTPRYSWVGGLFYIAAAVVTAAAMSAVTIRHENSVESFNGQNGLAVPRDEPPPPCGLGVPTYQELMRGVSLKDGAAKGRLDFIRGERDRMCHLGMYDFLADRVEPKPPHRGHVTTKQNDQRHDATDKEIEKSLCAQGDAREYEYALYGDMSARLHRAYANSHAAFTAYAYGRETGGDNGACYEGRSDPFATSHGCPRGNILKEHLLHAAQDLTAEGRGMPNWGETGMVLVVFRLHVLAIAAALDLADNGGKCFGNPQGLGAVALCDSVLGQHPHVKDHYAHSSSAPAPPAAPVGDASKTGWAEFPAYVEKARFSACTETFDDLFYEEVAAYRPMADADEGGLGSEGGADADDITYTQPPPRYPLHAACADPLRFELNDQRRLFGVPDGVAAFVPITSASDPEADPPLLSSFFEHTDKEVRPLWPTEFDLEQYKMTPGRVGTSLAAYAAYRLVMATVYAMIVLSVGGFVVVKALSFSIIHQADAVIEQAAQSEKNMPGANAQPLTPKDDAALIQRGAAGLVALVGYLFAGLWGMSMEPGTHLSPHYTQHRCEWRTSKDEANKGLPTVFKTTSSDDRDNEADVVPWLLFASAIFVVLGFLFTQSRFPRFRDFNLKRHARYFPIWVALLMGLTTQLVGVGLRAAYTGQAYKDDALGLGHEGGSLTKLHEGLERLLKAGLTVAFATGATTAMLNELPRSNNTEWLAKIAYLALLLLFVFLPTAVMMDDDDEPEDTPYALYLYVGTLTTQLVALAVSIFYMVQLSWFANWATRHRKEGPTPVDPSMQMFAKAEFGNSTMRYTYLPTLPGGV